MSVPGDLHLHGPALGLQAGAAQRGLWMRIWLPPRAPLEDQQKVVLRCGWVIQNLGCSARLIKLLSSPRATHIYFPNPEPLPKTLFEFLPFVTSARWIIKGASYFWRSTANALINFSLSFVAKKLLSWLLSRRILCIQQEGAPILHGIKDSA